MQKTPEGHGQRSHSFFQIPMSLTVYLEVVLEYSSTRVLYYDNANVRGSMQCLATFESMVASDEILFESYWVFYPATLRDFRGFGQQAFKIFYSEHD